LAVRRARNSNFNPRTREGCDGIRWDYHNRIEPISIHAPARGATHIHV